MERALSRVLVDTPSHLARDLVNDLCKSQLVNCQCCPAIVACLWKRQLSGQVRAGIAHCTFDAQNFNATVQLADDIHASAFPQGASSVAAVSLDETQPAIPYASVPEVAAVRGQSRGGRGRGRGPRNRGNRGGRGGGGSSQPKHSGTKHPDLPSGDWKGCGMHFKHGRSAYFCSEPSTCPWKDVFIAKPAKQ